MGKNQKTATDKVQDVQYRLLHNKKVINKIHKEQRLKDTYLSEFDSRYVRFDWFVQQISSQRDLLHSRTKKFIIYSAVSISISILAIVISVLK